MSGNTALTWVTSSHSNGAGGMCVQVAHPPGGGVRARGPKAPGSAELKYSRGEWEAFVDGVEGREFDGPQARG